MSALATPPAGVPLWAPRRGRWLVVGIHVPFFAVSPIVTIAGFEGRTPADPTFVALLGLLIAGLQLRHSLAAARGERPRGWIWTFLALAALAYVPLWWFGWNWIANQWFVVASGAMLLRGWPTALAVVGPILGVTVTTASTALLVDQAGLRESVVFTLYSLTTTVMGAGALYWCARLVRTIDQLYATRTEMAEVAIGRERLRASRDLHDLLGQSLSAVSLKGDLAVRLLSTDAPAALAEIESLTGVARRALRHMRAVALAEHEVSLRSEIDGAVALLDAGIAPSVDVDLAELGRPVEDLLAWAVREGTTNMLRHSQAQTCSITAARRDGSVRLEIVNNGAEGPLHQGSGLAGLAERAQALSGVVSAERIRGGRFRLVVEVPEGMW